MPIGAMRARDAGLPWWLCTVGFLQLTPPGIVFAIIGLIGIIWIGCATPKTPRARPTEAEPSHRPPGQLATAEAAIKALLHRVSAKFQTSKKRILIGGTIVLLLIAGGTTALAFALREERPDHAALLKCDTELRKQLLVPELTPNVPNAKAAIKAIQQQRPEPCAAKFWNPLATSVDSDHLGNIDITFSTGPGSANGAEVTMPADSNERWVYLAEAATWYAATSSSASRLATPPPTPRPTAQPNVSPNYLAKPAPTPDWRTLQQTRPAHPPTTIVADLANQFDYIGDEIFTGKALTEFNRAEDLYLQGEYQAAILAYELAKKHRNKPSRTIENRIGTSLQALDNHRQALARFTVALEIQDNPLDRVNRATSYVNNNQCQRAIQDSQRALEMNHAVSDSYHTDAEAHAIMAFCYLQSDDHHSTIEHANKALKLMNSAGYPAEELATIHGWAGTAHHLEQNYSEAIRQYSHAITLDDNADARASRAWAYWDTDDCTSAIEDSLVATELLPLTAPNYHTAAEGHLILYYCYADEERWSEALHHAEAALILMHTNGYDRETIELVENDIPSLRWASSQ